MNRAALDWRWRAFDALTLRELDAIYRVRQQVFVVEQHCAFIDADGHDSVSWHLAAWSANCSEPLAYARVVQPGEKGAEPSIGRVLTTSHVGRCGLGRELMRSAIEKASAVYPGQNLRVAAQTRLEPFYTNFGFASTGDAYIEDGIPHIDMLRPG